MPARTRWNTISACVSTDESKRGARILHAQRESKAMQNQTVAVNQSIVWGTLIGEDVAKAFAGELARLGIEYDSFAEFAGWTTRWRGDDDQLSYYVWEYLLDMLDEQAPDGYYFGAHPGDGSDFGFWPLSLNFGWPA